MRWNRSLAGFAALNGATGVALGAFAAHGAEPPVKSLLTTGASYQLVHAALGLICAVWPDAHRMVSTAGWLASIGGLIFSLALSVIGLASLPVFGALAPVGGVLMIAAWLMVALASFRSSASNT